MSTPTPDWAAIEQTPEFRALVRAKRAFIVPATLFFIAYYFALPALVGYWPDLMSTVPVPTGEATHEAWTLMAAYVSRARRYDRMVEDLLQRLKGRTS